VASVQILPVALAVVSLSTAAGSVALLVRRRAVASATLMLLTAGCGAAAAVLLAWSHDRTADRLLLGGATLLAPLALATFPRLRWRSPLDFLSLAVVGGCGVVATVYATPDVTALMGMVQGLALVAHTWWRIETASDRDRRALVWMALAVTSALLVFGFVVFSAEGSDGAVAAEVATVVFAAIAPAMYVGATLPDLVDVRGLVVSAVVTAVALITVMSTFILALGLLDAVGADDLNVGAQALVAALVATIYRPTTVVLRGVVDQLLFGERPDPLGAASRVADRIGTDPVPSLRAIREALVLPYAALLVDGEPVVASGVETTHTRTFELDGAGQLVVGLRPGDLAFSAGDIQVLRLTVPLLAQTLRARALAAEVLASRGQTIAAVAEERRRLRRDLHDGLGPRLSGIAFTSDAARNLVRQDPEAAEEMIDQLRADTVVAIEEIRRMVYAMRPPALDELGLVPALRQQAVGLRNSQGAPVVVSVEAAALPVLPAAVEVAAYRIVTEALANVARHSDSPSATVRIAATEDALRLEVTDGGTTGDWRPGVGLASMRERATELGGTLEAGPGLHGGRVAAVLPLRA
jgi:two-component system NarL family sensor kinase